MEELVKFELKQRENEGDETGLEELSNYWLKFKIYQVEQEWATEKFNECQIAHGLGEGVSMESEKEQGLAQHETNVEGSKEQPNS